jgi:hypothetical protein
MEMPAHNSRLPQWGLIVMPFPNIFFEKFVTHTDAFPDRQVRC